MKISKYTLSLLKNFTNINTSILIKKGNVLSIMSKDKSTYATAKIEETFPQEFAIYSIQRFLSTVALFQDPEFVFGEGHVRIETKNKHLIFRNAESISEDFLEEDLRKSQPKGVPKRPTTGVSIFLTAEDLKSINDASGALSLPSLKITSEDGQVVVSVVNPDNPVANSLVLQTEVETEAELNVTFSISKLIMVAGGYDLTIYSPAPGVTTGYFKHEAKDLEYWISADVSSEFSL